MDRIKFIEVWKRSGTLDEVSAELGEPKRKCSNFAAYIRSVDPGLNLKHFQNKSNGNHNKPAYIPTLEEIYGIPNGRGGFDGPSLTRTIREKGFKSAAQTCDPWSEVHTNRKMRCDERVVQVRPLDDSPIQLERNPS